MFLLILKILNAAVVIHSSNRPFVHSCFFLSLFTFFCLSVFQFVSNSIFLKQINFNTFSKANRLEDCVCKCIILFSFSRRLLLEIENLATLCETIFYISSIIWERVGEKYLDIFLKFLIIVKNMAKLYILADKFLESFFL